MSFWIPALLISLLVGGMVVLAILRGRTRVQALRGYDMQVYRDQLDEVERDRARGVISDADADRVRVEVSRRLLDADKAAQNAGAATTTASGPLVPVALGLGVIAAAFGIYWQLGALHYPDLPLAERLEMAERIHDERPSQAEIEADFPPLIVETPSQRMQELMTQLRATLVDRPDDLQGHVLLARNEASLGDFVAAYKAQEQVVRIKGDAAVAADHANLADLMILAANGYVSPQAETHLNHALQLEPQNGAALYYSGLMFAQNYRADFAFRIWSDLLIDSTPDAPWVPPIRQQIEQVAAEAGVRYTLPPLETLRGPDAGDVAAAADMTEEERMDMIRGMVDGLSARLANEGGSAQEWARLIGALGVLGETERAAAIWQESQTVFASDPEALNGLREAATRAGVAN